MAFAVCNPINTFIQKKKKKKINDLQQLHNVALTVKFDNVEQNVRCFLAQIVGDNLGIHA